MAALEASPMATESTLPGTLTCVASLAGHSERVWHAAWSPDGSLLASCSSDRCVKIWHCAGGAWGLVSTLDDAHERTVRKCDWSPCGRYLAAVSFDGTCCVWRRADDGDDGGPLEWEIIATLEGHENEVKAAAWNASGTLLATCGRDKAVWLWECGDDDAFEGKLVADRSVLTQLPMKRESAADVAKFVEKQIADVKALHTVQFPTHTANLYERIKHNPARGLDLDYEIPSWHYDYRPYNQYVPPVDGEAQIQAPDYERDGDQAWRRDYYINGPGNQAEVNNEYAILNAPEETE